MTTKNATTMRYVNGSLSLYTPDLSANESVLLAFVQDATEFESGSKCVVKMTPKQAARFIDLFTDQVEDFIPDENYDDDPFFLLEND